MTKHQELLNDLEKFILQSWPSYEGQIGSLNTARFKHIVAKWAAAREVGAAECEDAAVVTPTYVTEEDHFQLVQQHKALSEVVMKLGARVEELAGQPAMHDFKSHIRVLDIIKTWSDEVVRMSQTRLGHQTDPHSLVSLLKECGYEIVTVRKTT